MWRRTGSYRTPLFHLPVCTMCKQMGFWPKQGSSAQALQEQSHTFKCGGPRCAKPTHVSPTRLDDDSSTAAGLLLGLSHALPGFLVGVVCGAYRDFVLDPSQAVQLYAPFTGQKPSLSDTPNGTDYATFSPVMHFKCVAMAHLQPRWLDGRPLKGNTCREVPYRRTAHPSWNPVKCLWSACPKLGNIWSQLRHSVFPLWLCKTASWQVFESSRKEAL